MVTKLADIIIPEIFTPYVQLLSTERSAFVQSGIAEQSPLFDQLLQGGGQTFKLPFFNDLGNAEANVSSDNEASSSTPEKIDTVQDIAVRHSRNQSWSSMDLAAALAGSDPMTAIASRVADYWVRQEQRYIIDSLNGVLSDNEATPTGTDKHVQNDMVHNIANDSASAITDAELFSADAFLQAVQTMGDAGEELVAIAVHSVVFRRMQVKNLIDFIPDARGEVQIATFLGRRVIVDDLLPAVAGSNRITYTSILFGRNSIARGSGTPRVPTEMERLPAAGDGGGQEVLFSRVERILHPRGWRWTSVSMAGSSPMNAELANAANWSRQWERKLTRVAFLKTNG